MSRTALLTILAIVAAILLAGSVKPGKTTHLGVASNVLVSLQTTGVPNDDTSGHQFYYDGFAGAPFGPIPDNTSFVVTDIVIHPWSTLEDALFLILIDFEGRSFQAKHWGAGTKHYPLSGGIVIPANATPTCRNTLFSDANADVELIGYFTKGAGLAFAQSPF